MTKEQAHRLGFRIKVPAKGQTTLTCRVKTRSAGGGPTSITCLTRYYCATNTCVSKRVNSICLCIQSLAPQCIR